MFFPSCRRNAGSTVGVACYVGRSVVCDGRDTINSVTPGRRPEPAGCRSAGYDGRRGGHLQASSAAIQWLGRFREVGPTPKDRR
jgi:hypothetical protein